MENLAIVILNYNSSDKIINQVMHLMNGGINASNFYIIDNNSNIQNQNKIQTFVKTHQLNFIQSTENGGYAKGNRIALEKALSDNKLYFLIINPDIEISALVIRQLYDSISNDENLFILGPRICDKEDREIIFSDGGKLNKDRFFEASHINVGKNINEVEIPLFNYDIDYINGSAMMFRKESINLLGMMREDFFMYFEEAEWCYRLKKTQNAKQAIITSLVVYHELSKTDLFKKFYMTRNRIFMCRLYKIPHKKLIMHFLYEAQKDLFNKKRNFVYNIRLFFSQLRAILEGEFRNLN